MFFVFLFLKSWDFVLSIKKRLFIGRMTMIKGSRSATPFKSLSLIIFLFGIAFAFRSTEARVQSADYYLIVQGRLIYTFVDANSIRAVSKTHKIARIISVNEGVAEPHRGYKFMAQLIDFDCKSSTYDSKQSRTYDRTGRALTEGAGSGFGVMRKNTVSDDEFKFVCNNSRDYPGYGDDDPVDSSDKLFAVVSNNRDPSQGRVR
jgi:hypothetical protein